MTFLNGGKGEIITDDKGGILLRADFDSDEPAGQIHKFVDMDEEEYQKYRGNARDD